MGGDVGGVRSASVNGSKVDGVQEKSDPEGVDICVNVLTGVCALDCSVGVGAKDAGADLGVNRPLSSLI